MTDPIAPVDFPVLPEDKPPTSWPLVVGIVAIVFGALAAIGSCLGGAMIGIFGSMIEDLDLPAATGLEGIMAHRTLMVVLTGVSTVLAVLLLVAGIGLVRRRAWSRSLVYVWAPLKMAYGVANAWVGFQVNRVQFEAMREDPNLAAMPSGLMEVFGLGGAILGAIWAWALPVFLMFWFARGAIRDEVRGWKASP